MQKVFGVLGHPIAHSLSPTMLGSAFEKKGIEASFEKFDIPPSDLGKFIERVREEKIQGLSVTIPHKIEIMKYLDEIEESAKGVGAVNTVFWRDEKLVGGNTDWVGFLETLEEKIDAKEKEVVILGGGGAAHAITYALLTRDCKITIITREAWEYEDLAKHFEGKGLKFDFIQNLDKYNPQILVNSTPLGMKGDFEGKSFVDASWFENHKPIVFDIVYTPSETKLLQDAKKKGCETIEGLGMLVRQGGKQFEIWMGEKPNLETMFEAARSKLEK